jgi:hypothetical protein
MADEPNNGGTPATPPKVEFNEAQQAKVQELIDKAVGRVAGNLRSEYEPKLATLQTELTEAKEAAKAAKTGTQKNEANADVAALQAQIDEMKSASRATKDEVTRWQTEAQTKAREVEDAKAEALNIRKDVAITNAASKVNFVNTEVVLKLTKDNIKYDSEKGRFIVLSDSGQPRLNAAMEDMTLDEFYTEFAAKNKYLVRGDIVPGTNSSENTRSNLSKNGQYEVKDIFGPKSNSRLANELAKADPAEYKRLKAIARTAGLVV